MKAFTLRHTALTFALALAHAQGAWAGTATVALSGRLASGTGPGVQLASFSDLVLNAAGQVAYQATLVGTNVDTTNNASLWRDGNLIARTGDLAPGIGDSVRFKAFSEIAFNDAGELAYIAVISTRGFSNEGIWRGGQLVVRDTNPAPGTGAVFSSFRNLSISNNGQLAYSSSLAGNSVFIGQNSESLWRDTSLVARTASAAGGAGAGVTFSQLDVPQINAAGQIAYRAELQGTGVTGINDDGIWRNSTLIARSGNAAPGTGANFSTLLAPQINASGHVAYQARLAGTDIDLTNASSIWLDNTLVARDGQSAPGTAAGVKFINMQVPLLNAAGQVVFKSGLTGSGVTLENDEGIWRDRTLIARAGDAVPNTQGTVRYADVDAAQLNASGLVSFRGGLTGAGVSAANNVGLYLSDGEETLQIARKGAALAGSTIASILKTPVAGNFRSIAGHLNDLGQVAYQADLTDGRSGVFLYTPELSWRRSTGGNWADAGNWTLSITPAQVHDVVIDPGMSMRINGPGNTVTLKTLQLGTGAGRVTLAMAGGRIESSLLTVGSQGVLTGLGSFGGAVLNQGVVQSDGLLFDGGLTNAGTLRGATGLGSMVNGDLNNASTGRVRVGASELLQLSGKAHQNAGVVEVNGGRLESAGSMVNAKAGIIDLKNATLVADGAWRNEAGGRLLMNEARLTTSGGLTNAGQVQVTSGSSEVFGAVVNQKAGQILLSGQGTTTFYDAVELQSGSELRTSAGATAVFFGAVAQRSGALLTGTGQKYFEGALSVGNSPGLGEDAGSVSLGLGSTYLAEIGGTVLGTGYDHYRVAGTLTLGGTLQLVSFAGFRPQAGQQFDLFDGGTLQGQFSAIDSSGLQLDAGTTLDLSRLYTDGVISVTAVPEPGSWALMLAGTLGLAGLRRRAGATGK